MRILAAIMAICYGLSLVGLWATGLGIAVPWTMVVYLLLLVFPFAYVLARGPLVLEALGIAMPAPVGVLLGLTLILIFHSVSSACVCLPLFMFVVADLVRQYRHGSVPLLALGVPALLLCYGTVWNLNYLFGLWSVGRLQDAPMAQLDLAIYERLSDHEVELAGLYPMFESRWLFQFLENGYLMLFLEIMVVVILLAQDRARLTRFFAMVFSAYLVGLLIFLAYPVLGPGFHFPEAFHADYEHSKTFRILSSTRQEYQAIQSFTPLNGFGYFVGLPSLHVAMALLLQYFLATFRSHFWIFVPVNITLIFSTVLLGYHYLIDVFAGALLAAFVLLMPIFFSKNRIEAKQEALAS